MFWCPISAELPFFPMGFPTTVCAGGSKEAFHLVYQAFETLSDPEARQRYDASGVPAPQAPKVPPQAPKGRKAKQRQRFGRSQGSAEGGKRKKAQKSPRSDLERLMNRLYQVLKALPREVRNEVISKEFSQKQRVLLENWIVNQREETDTKPQTAKEDPVATSADGEEHVDQCVSLQETSLAVQKCQSRPVVKHRTRQSRQAFKKKKKKKGNTIKGICRIGASRYQASIFIGPVSIHTRSCDLDTALEFLVFLTSIKQRMKGAASVAAFATGTFPGRLEETLQESLLEHGRWGTEKANS